MAQPECQSTSTKYQYRQVHELDQALSTMTRYGIPESAEAYQTLYKQRGALLAEIGYKFPRTVTPLGMITGMSPGMVRVWHDGESGWMSEARARPGAPPVYHAISDDVAMAILKREVTPELEKTLMTPDPYLGE